MPGRVDAYFDLVQLAVERGRREADEVLVPQLVGDLRESGGEVGALRQREVSAAGLRRPCP